MDSERVATSRGQSVRQAVQQDWRPGAILIQAPSRLLAGHGYLAWAAFPGAADEKARARALDALTHATARQLPRHERPESLRNLPRDQKINSALQPIQRRLNDARLAGLIAANLAWKRWLADEAWARRTIHYAACRAQELVPMAHTRGADVQRRVWRRHFPMIHLCVPLSLARLPANVRLEIASRHHELVPLLMPGDFTELVTSDSWVLQALDVAERWRQALPVMAPDQPELRGLPRINAWWLD